jgi:hypothetical protein
LDPVPLPVVPLGPGKLVQVMVALFAKVAGQVAGLAFTLYLMVMAPLTGRLEQVIQGAVVLIVGFVQPTETPKVPGTRLSPADKASENWRLNAVAVPVFVTVTT